jgi:hypothetical protein
MNCKLIATIALLLLALPVHAQSGKRKLTVNAETPEGALLQQAGQEADAAKKLQLLEEFAEKYPQHESATWALGEIQAAALKANDFDKAIAAGDKILAADPDDVAVAESNLRAAEGKKDAAALRKYAAATAAAAARLTASPKPADEEAAEAWSRNVSYSKTAATYAEYALSAAALSAADPDTRIAMSEALEKLNPKSQYMAPLFAPLMAAYQQKGNNARALQVAEIGLAADPNNDDMLLFAASQYYEGMKDKAKVTSYAKRLVATLPAKTAPQGIDPDAWAKNRDFKLGIAQWMLGVMASNESRWADADSHLRAALPLIKDNKDLAAETLFHLGLANYKIGDPKQDKNRILEALRFNQECANIPGRFQAQARKNVAAIRSQYHITR